ncbi:MAG: hypothetical protein ACLVJZ_11005 [[Clostridium] leptum]
MDKYGYAMANGGEGRFSFRDLEMVALSNGFQPDDTLKKPKTLISNPALSDISLMPEAQSAWQYLSCSGWNEDISPSCIPAPSSVT